MTVRWADIFRGGRSIGWDEVGDEGPAAGIPRRGRKLYDAVAQSFFSRKETNTVQLTSNEGGICLIDQN